MIKFGSIIVFVREGSVDVAIRVAQGAKLGLEEINRTVGVQNVVTIPDYGGLILSGVPPQIKPGVESKEVTVSE